MAKAQKAAPQAVLIDRLNPIIRGRANYFSNVCSKSTYSSMDNLMYHKLRVWARRRHPNQNQHWIAHKYWLIGTGEGWVFASRNDQHPMRLFQHARTPIKRHIKVQGSRSPYDGDWIYWSRRMGHHPAVTLRVARLLKHQAGQCAHCGLYFFSDDLMEVHHMDRNQNNHKQVNLALTHRHCHDQIHAKCV